MIAASLVAVPSRSPARDTIDGRAFPGRWVAAALAASLAAVALLMWGAGLSLALAGPGGVVFGAVFALLGAIRWRLRHPRSNRARIVRDAAEYVGVSTAISLVGAVASYPVAAYSHGFADAALQRCDEALRFDWLAWYRFTAAHPAIQLISRNFYALIYLSPAVLLAHYAVRNKRREAYDFMAAVWLSAVMTLAGYVFMPAVGPFAYLWRGPAPYLPVSDLWQPDLIPKLRTGAFTVVDPGRLVGLVSAPSFHAAAAVLLMAFAWRERPVRAALIAANLAMLLATPVEGTHYLIDLILGALVALVSLAGVGLIRRAIPAATVTCDRVGARTPAPAPRRQSSRP